MNRIPASLIILLVIIASVTTYFAGYYFASKNSKRSIAIISLAAVEPAILVSASHSREKNLISKELALSAEESIFHVAAQSIYFESEIHGLPKREKKILCLIAKDRLEHKKFFKDGGIYGEQIMEHLRKLHENLTNELGDDCSVSDKIDKHDLPKPLITR